MAQQISIDSMPGYVLTIDRPDIYLNVEVHDPNGEEVCTAQWYLEDH